VLSPPIGSRCVAKGDNLNCKPYSAVTVSWNVHSYPARPVGGIASLMLGPYLRFGNNKVGAWFVADKISKDSLLIHAALTEVEEDAAFGKILGLSGRTEGFFYQSSICGKDERIASRRTARIFAITFWLYFNYSPNSTTSVTVASAQQII